MLYILFTHLLYNIIEPVGSINQIPKLNQSEITEFTKDKNISVIIFHDQPSFLTYTQYGIRKYSNEIDFALASQESGLAFGCEDFPCFITFRKGTMFLVDEPPATVFGFSLWLNSLFDSHIQTVYSAEKVRQLFLQHKTFWLAVDSSVPDDFPKDEYIYQVTSETLQALHINVHHGIYVFRYPERQLVNVVKNYKSYSRSPLINLYNSATNISSKPYFGGFMIDENMDSENEKISYLALHLASKFLKKLGITIFTSDYLFDFKTLGHFSLISEPIFVIFDTTNFSRKWIYKDPNIIYSKIELSKIIEDIIGNKIEPNVISQPDNQLVEGGLNANNFVSKVLNEDSDVAVVFTHTVIEHLNYLELMVNKVSSMFEPTAKIYTYLVTENEIPKEISPFIDNYFPTMLIWKKNNKDKPIRLKESIKLQTMINFMLEECSDCVKPEYNSTIIYHEIEKTFKEKYQNNKSKTEDL